jgi:hypothetical protein
MSDYGNELGAHRAAEQANRQARREAAQDAADRRASLAATRAQIKAARGHDGTPSEPEYKPEAEWSTTERQLFAAYGRKPVKGDDD